MIATLTGILAFFEDWNTVENICRAVSDELVTTKELPWTSTLPTAEHCPLHGTSVPGKRGRAATLAMTQCLKEKIALLPSIERNRSNGFVLEPHAGQLPPARFGQQVMEPRRSFVMA